MSEYRLARRTLIAGAGLGGGFGAALGLAARLGIGPAQADPTATQAATADVWSGEYWANKAP